MMRRRAMSSARRPSAWLAVVGGLVLYGVAVVMLALARISPTLLLPWWIAQAVPPIVYALLVGVCVRPVSVSRWLAGTGLLWVVHVVLGVLTAGVVASMGAWSVDLSGVEAFPPPLIPEILWVPLLLIPLRDSIAGHRRPVTGRGMRDREIDTRMAAPAPVRQAPMTTTQGVVPASGDVKWPQRAPRDAEPEPQAPTTEQPTRARAATGQASTPILSALAPTTRIAETSPPRIDETAGEETLNAPMRISFGRIADQFPAGAFNVPLDEVSASLADPGHLSIPSRLVLAQLAEGLVHARWDVIAPQIPEQLLAVTGEEMTEQMTDARLILPLDELVPQVPLDLLTSGGKPVDVHGIERFPAPFQPTGAQASPVREDPAPSTGWTASPSEWALVDEADSDGEAAELPVLEDVELDETLTGLAEIGPETASGTPSVPTQPHEMVEFRDAAAPAPSELKSTADMKGEAPLSLPAPVAPARAPARMETARDAAAGPPIADGIDVVVASVDGVKILASSSSSLSADVAVAVAKRLLAVLSAVRGVWTMSQMTLRGPDGALILTPLRSLAGAGSVLVSAVPLGGSLALAEIRALRAAGISSDAVAAQESGEAPGHTQDEDLVETEPSPDALGSIVATTLCIRETGRELHVFLPRDSDVHAVARLARDIDRVLRAVAGCGSLFHTAVLRCGARRLIIRMDGSDTANSSIIIVGGETGRPGLACRQAEDAALALGVR